MEVSVMRHLPDPFSSYHSRPTYQPWESRKRPSPTEREQRACRPYDYPTHESNYRFPPSPPMERQSHTSLPPISTLLANMREGQPEVDRSKRARLDSSRIDPRLSGPPTPPSRPHHYEPQRSAPAPVREPLPSSQPASYPTPHDSRQSSTSSFSSRPPVHHHHRLSSSSWSTSSARAPSPQSAPSLESSSARSLYPPPSLMPQRSVPEYSPRTPQSPPTASTPGSHISDYDRQHYAMSQGPQQYGPGPSSAYAAHGPPGTSTIHMSSSSASGPQTTHPDRYVCPQCAKAFSRPSSLRIHVHSHTGEKPFVCPHAGCGKAFSVRSNMKRHQRGCHVDGGSIKDVGDDAEMEDA